MILGVVLINVIDTDRESQRQLRTLCDSLQGAPIDDRYVKAVDRFVAVFVRCGGARVLSDPAPTQEWSVASERAILTVLFRAVDMLHVVDDRRQQMQPHLPGACTLDSDPTASRVDPGGKLTRLPANQETLVILARMRLPYAEVFHIGKPHGVARRGTIHLPWSFQARNGQQVRPGEVDLVGQAHRHRRVAGFKLVLVQACYFEVYPDRQFLLHVCHKPSPETRA
jgi:hypothetical protein